MKKIKAYPETHQHGTIMVENVQFHTRESNLRDSLLIEGDFGVQIAEDGRAWICINGIAFIRFSPHSNGKMSPPDG